MEETTKNTIDDPLTFKVIGCAMKVHQELGPGFQEVIYQRCLAIELERAGLEFHREQEHVVVYQGMQVGTRRADFIVANRIVIEIKALTRLEDAHIAQCKNYAIIYDHEIGLLINFGARSLEYKRVYNPKYNQRAG